MNTTPLNNSIVATRCFIFAESNRHNNYNDASDHEPVQFGWDAETRSVWVIAKCGCFRLFATDKKFPEFETARMATRKLLADSPIYHGNNFRKHDRPAPQGWESVTA